MSSPKVNAVPRTTLGQDLQAFQLRAAQPRAPLVPGPAQPTVLPPPPGPALGPAANDYVNRAMPKPVGLPPPHPRQTMHDYAVKQGIVRTDANRNLMPPVDPAKLLYQGAYGCAYRPPLTCDGEFSAKKGTITKLMSKKNADNEKKEAAIVQSVDPAQKYFVYAERSCDRTIGFNTPDTVEIEKCRAANSIPRGEKASMLIMDDGGSSLQRLDISKPATHGPVLASFRTLMVGLQRLHDAGHVHFDIKPDNIVTNGEFKTRFIDFGLMRPHNPYAVDNGIYIQNYPYWPFELKFLSNRIDLKTLQNELVRFRDDSIKFGMPSRDRGMLTGTTGMFPPEDVADEWLALNDDMKTDKIPTASKILIGTDVYALGRAMAEFYNRMTFHTPDKKMTEILYGNPRDSGATKPFPPDKKKDIALSEFSKKWYTMTENMTHLSPSKRWSLLHAIDYFDTDISPIIKQFFPETGASRRGTKRKKGGRTRRRNFPRVG